MDYAAFILLSLGLLLSVFNIDKNLAKSLKIEVLIYIVSLFCFFLSNNSPNKTALPSPNCGTQFPN